MAYFRHVNLLTANILTILLLAGCSSAPVDSYQCENQMSFSVEMQPDIARVKFAGEEQSLPRARSGSGTLFESADRSYSFFGKGDEAMLDWNGKALRGCKLQK